MSFLLDTHVWLWAIDDMTPLGRRTRDLLVSPDSKLFLSAVSSWEATIKWRLGKLRLPGRPEEIVKHSLEHNRLDVLPVTHEHACRVGDLPHHHDDPFDRLLIAQALAQGLQLVTADAALRAYRVPIHWALD